MKGPDPACEVISLARARTLRFLGDHPDRPLDKLAVPPSLLSSKLPPSLSQDVGNVLCCGLGELMVQNAYVDASSSASNSAAIWETERFDNRPDRA
jgi:hypothetical protein